MKLVIGCSVLMTSILLVFSSAAQAQSTFAIKPHHSEVFGEGKHCDTCHISPGKKTRPPASVCIDCHGGMSEIPIKPNKYEKDPHHSHHYEDTLDCITCHKEHKKSHAICVDCHIVEFDNFQ